MRDLPSCGFPLSLSHNFAPDTTGGEDEDEEEGR